jgi:hypothetical protein
MSTVLKERPYGLEERFTLRALRLMPQRSHHPQASPDAITFKARFESLALKSCRDAH